ncbi:Protein FixA [Labeo rohita]|uniref:Protein FixA n=1 Tax=Labeo rohita TaxID=84645 RepID=A0ABQ8LQ79_LABRO|nr:Protein FixA [Labeo rohita]
MESQFPPQSTSQRITPESESNPSDQVRELATVPTMREQALDDVSAEGELIIHLRLLDFKGDLIDGETNLEPDLAPLFFIPASSRKKDSVPEYSQECGPIPEGSPSTCPQPTIHMVQAPQVCHPPSSLWLEYPSPPLDSTSASRPRRSTSATSSLASTITRRSTSSTGLPHPSGSTIASGLHSSGFTLLLCSTGSSLLPAPPWSSVISASVARALGFTLAPWILGIPLARWLSVSASSSYPAAV